MVEVRPKIEPPQDPDEADIEASRMTLGEHLDELRKRLIRSTVVLLVCFVVAWALRVPLFGFVVRPYEDSATRLSVEIVRIADEKIAEGADWRAWYQDGYPEVRNLRADRQISTTLRGDTAGAGFVFDMKICFYFALAFGGPVLLWEMWQFIAAGLYRRERRVVLRYFPISFALFVAGIAFGFFAMIPAALYFLAVQTLDRIQWYQTADNYWSMVVNMTLALGFLFQLPVVMLALARLGLVEVRSYAKYRGHMMVGALVVGAILTPPDPITQMLMAGPIIVLYEVGIWVSRWATRRARPQGSA